MIKVLLLSLMVGGQSLDLTSTAHMVGRGCVEANPVYSALHMTSPLRISIVRGGIAAGVSIGYWRRYREHPKQQSTVAALTGSVGLLAAAHNYRMVCR